MKLRKTFGIFTLGAGLALSFGLTASIDTPSAMAQGKGAPAKGKPAPAAKDAPTTKKAVTIQPSDLAWGIDKKKLATVYDKVIEEDFKPRYQKAQPGPQMDRLDAEVAERKSEFRRSEIQFGTIPTGMDTTPLRPEYSYNNQEYLLSIDRGGKTRYFFFINDKMWKIVDAIKLGEKSAWGKNFDEAINILNKYYGVDGRVRAADEAAGRPFKEVDWKDSNTQVRAVEWGEDQFGLIFQDSATVSQLSGLRKNKETNAKDVDAKVKDAGAKKPPPPPAKDEKKPKK